LPAVNQTETPLSYLRTQQSAERAFRGVFMKVLVVDDYATMRRIIRNQLNQLGYNDIDEAETGEDALTKLREAHYNLVISDWNMEPMSGYDLLRKVRSDQKLKDTTFIMITAEAKAENAIAAKEAGADNYLLKPFNAKVLGDRIGTALARKPH
jgi:two-component system, chemotaxis family, chemotaxis protein CheY